MAELEKRGREAAAAYLDRCGMTVVDVEWSGRTGHPINIVALEDDVLVFVKVVTIKAATNGKQPGGLTTKQQSKLGKLSWDYIESSGLDERSTGHDIKWRWDLISLLVITEDRALLRHHRAWWQPL